MLRTYVRSHRSSVLTGVVAAVVGAVVATTAVVSGGYQAQRVDLGDGTVWVPSAQYGAVGRVNTGVLQLNTAVQASDDALAVVQRGAAVYSVDETRATISHVDITDATVGDPVTLPAGSPQVFFAGSTAIIGNADTGEVWSTPTSRLDEFDASTKADLTLGQDAAFDADDEHVAVYSPRTATASLVAVGQTLRVAKTDDVRMSRKHDLQVAAVGTHLAVLDRTDATLAIDGRTIDLGDRVSGSPSLQHSASSGSDVVVASASGLLRVSTAGTVRSVALAVSGTAARPYVDGSCTYAAWNGGQAVNTCNGAAVQRLADVPASAELTISHNGSTVVANDPDSGRTWAIDRSGQLIDNWGDLVQRDETQQQEQSADEDPEVDTEQKPPVAVDDALGARPGRTTVLPVLLNDYDPNGDPIAIERVSDIDTGTLALIDDRQRLQVTLTDRASGTVQFDYDISDGNGGTASATVTLTVKRPDENGPPVQVRDTVERVVQNGQVASNVLTDWIDPEGDPVYLVAAAAPDGDAVTTTPDGSVDYSNTSGRTGRRTVSLEVSDGRASGRGSVTVSVAAQGKVPLTAESFAVTAYAGTAQTITPLAHVRGGNGTVTLTSVPAVTRATVTPSYDAGTFSVTSDSVGDHQVEYTVSDGVKTASGIVRVTVLARPDASNAPITTPKTVFVSTLSTKDTDVTATDIDPAGGVLLVTGVTGLPARSGVQANVLDQHIVRVTLTAPLDGAVSFTYEETNGVASAAGTVTVIEIPEPDQAQPPVAQPDTATVRVGDIATIDVLANDTQAEGEPLTLQPELVQNVPGDAGLLFVSGDSLRYLAPRTPGNYTAVYRVEGPDHQYADAVVSIAVREKDAATNAPPMPQTITARVVAGQSVQVTVPLSGIDPDGDSVQLVGVASNPDRGSVSDITTASLVYEAGEYAAGTDEFTYTVVDQLGARATGTIRVGIAPRANTAANPVAQADHVTIRPGGSVTVRVLENDSDPDGGDLTVTGIESHGEGVRAKVIRNHEVRVTPPATAKRGEYAVLYTAANEDGGASTAFLTVTVDQDAQPLRPEAADTVLDLQDILHRRTITVDVLRNVFFAEGTTADLRVGLVPGYSDNARVTGAGRVQVTVTDASQAIPFSVARRDHPEIVSYAFVQVPGLDDALPQLNRNAGAVTVKSESTVQIPLSRYVVTANGAAAKITDPSTVKATHSNGADLVVDASHLTFTSAKLYYGSASISFEVTDGSDANNGAGRTATLVLPIKVTPQANQAPAFTGSTVEMQPGESRTFDLTKMTNYPYPRDVPELRYSIASRPAAGTTVSVNGQQMTVKVADSVRKGTTASVGVSVADATNTGRAGTVAVHVVGSTRPLAQPAPDRAVVQRGRTTTVDVLANDAATNPFPDEPLTVVAIRGLSEGLPAGVSVTPSSDRSRLSVSVSDTARPLDTNFQYQVTDATGDADRAVWGNVTISVQDVPDQPSAPARTGTFQGGRLTLAWTAPGANNAPITDYHVAADGYQHDCGTSTVCTLTDLDASQRYTFTVTAVNAVGSSAPSAPSASLGADYVPAAPTGLRVAPNADTPNQVDISWAAVPRPSGGTPVTSYLITLTGPTGSQTRTSTGTSTQFSGLQSGGSYTATVSARNAAQVSSPSDWTSASATAIAVGRPTSPSGVTGDAVRSGDHTVVTVTFGPSDGQGAAVTGYALYRLTSPTFACANPSGSLVDSAGPDATSLHDAPGTNDVQYYYAVVVRNASGFCASGVSGQVTSYTVPGAASATVALVPDAASGTWDVAVSDLSATGPVDHWEVNYGNAGAWARVSAQGETGPGAGYGTRSDVQVRACPADDTFCGDASSAVSVRAVRTRATITGTPTAGEQLPVPTAPSNGALNPTSYDVSFCVSLAVIPSQCATVTVAFGAAMPTVPAVPGEYAYVFVAATVDGHTDPNPPTASIAPSAVAADATPADAPRADVTPADVTPAEATPAEATPASPAGGS